MVCFVSVWSDGRESERGPFLFGCLTFLGFGIPPCSAELSPLSCRAGLLERGCVLLGVRVPSAMRFHMGLGSKIVCSIDEKVA